MSRCEHADNTAFCAMAAVAFVHCWLLLLLQFGRPTAGGHQTKMQSKPLVFARLVVLLRLQMPCSSAVLIRSCPLQRSGTMAIPRQAIAGPVGGSGLSLPHHQDDKYYIGYAVRRQPTAPSDSCPQTLKTISDHLPMHRGVLVMLTGIPFPTAPHWRNSRIQSTPPGCCAVALPPPCAGGFLRPAPAAASLCSRSCRVSCSIVRRCCSFSCRNLSLSNHRASPRRVAAHSPVATSHYPIVGHRLVA